MSKSKVIQAITDYPADGETFSGSLWTNPAYGLSPEVDLVSTWEEAKAYVSLIY